MPLSWTPFYLSKAHHCYQRQESGRLDLLKTTSCLVKGSYKQECRLERLFAEENDARRDGQLLPGSLFSEGISNRC